jgi:hypothetical protein
VQAGDQKINNLHYQWKLPAAGDCPEMMIAVRGRDPELFTTYSLKRLAEDSAAVDEEEKD